MSRNAPSPLRLLNPFYVYERRSLIIPSLRDLFHRAISSSFFPITKDDKSLCRFKNIHQGKRAFIIGNGPSLSIDDLDRLKGDISFAFNKIYLCFQQTEWRPTYYMVEDFLVAPQNYQEINALKGFPKFFPEYLKDKTPPFENSIYFRLYSPPWNMNRPRPFSLNPLNRLYTGSTVTYTAMQLAAYMGIREMVLIGMDFNFILPKNRDGDQSTICINNTEVNHFHAGYRKAGEKWFAPNLMHQEHAFDSAKRKIEALDGKILNATRGGKLEVFDRVDFDSLFEG